jgi:transcription elongation factor Elf1
MSVVLIQSRKRNNTKNIGRRIATENEFIIFCPKCNAFETVCLVEDMLVPTKKYIQVGTRIYHDCGSDKPCYLYHTF